ncbi:unnamed protein product [Didymodactylos carnosus]|uniref:Kinesin motor domain-containing protein n=1 Tax=Didymodactylos carnosus TaxID=1234261 RepID=A0A813QV58_9BILA|nr:unnamed protein product [Didymodactylos carnosus]CAF0919647.1 unnamed protein product [Didymodactylos carnosus]CAF3555844.1 unnamed protein product [Didymodactylos carnosus]CAF3697331.1 unnamed protein product [Didymodactylos carnosus]
MERQNTDEDKIKHLSFEMYCRILPLRNHEHRKSIKLVSENQCRSNLDTGANFKFSKIFGEEDTLRAIFERYTQSSIADLIRGQNNLLIVSGRKKAGRSDVLFGTKSNPGIIPLSLDTLYNSIKDRIANKYHFKKVGTEFRIQTDAEAMLDRQTKDLLPKIRHDVGGNITTITDRSLILNDTANVSGLIEENVYAVLLSCIETTSSTDLMKTITTKVNERSTELLTIDNSVEKEIDNLKTARRQFSDIAKLPANERYPVRAYTIRLVQAKETESTSISKPTVSQLTIIDLPTRDDNENSDDFSVLKHCLMERNPDSKQHNMQNDLRWAMSLNARPQLNRQEEKIDEQRTYVTTTTAFISTGEQKQKQRQPQHRVAPVKQNAPSLPLLTPPPSSGGWNNAKSESTKINSPLLTPLCRLDSRHSDAHGQTDDLKNMILAESDLSLWLNKLKKGCKENGERVQELHTRENTLRKELATTLYDISELRRLNQEFLNNNGQTDKNKMGNRVNDLWKRIWGCEEELNRLYEERDDQLAHRRKCPNYAIFAQTLRAIREMLHIQSELLSKTTRTPITPTPKRNGALLHQSPDTVFERDCLESIRDDPTTPCSATSWFSQNFDEEIKERGTNRNSDAVPFETNQRSNRKVGYVRRTSTKLNSASSNNRMVPTSDKSSVSQFHTHSIEHPQTPSTSVKYGQSIEMSNSSSVPKKPPRASWNHRTQYGVSPAQTLYSSRSPSVQQKRDQTTGTSLNQQKRSLSVDRRLPLSTSSSPQLDRKRPFFRIPSNSSGQISSNERQQPPSFLNTQNQRDVQTMTGNTLASGRQIPAGPGILRKKPSDRFTPENYLPSSRLPTASDTRAIYATIDQQTTAKEQANIDKLHTSSLLPQSQDQIQQHHQLRSSSIDRRSPTRFLRRPPPLPTPLPSTSAPEIIRPCRRSLIEEAFPETRHSSSRIQLESPQSPQQHTSRSLSLDRHLLRLGKTSRQTSQSPPQSIRLDGLPSFSFVGTASSTKTLKKMHESHIATREEKWIKHLSKGDERVNIEDVRFKTFLPDPKIVDDINNIDLHKASKYALEHRALGQDGHPVVSLYHGDILATYKGGARVVFTSVDTVQTENLLQITQTVE